MKNILHTIFCVFATFTFAQAQTQVNDDFEGNGTITWKTDDCNLDANKSNPFVDANNNSATVLEYEDVGGLFANIYFDIDNPFDLTNAHTFTLKVYLPSAGVTGSQPNQISLKLQDGTSNQPWTSQSEIIHPLVLDQWQTITFDFLNDPFINAPQSSGPPTQRTDFNRVLIQINGENNADGVIAYIDDFSYDGTVLADPDFSYLVWADEFDVDGAVDTSKWFHQTQLPDGVSWFNGEIQHYTNRIDNAEVSNGNLSIVAKRETFTDQGQTKQFTSARLNSKFTFKQGRVEVRAKLPTGVGTWPAIWMLGKNIIEPGAYWDNQGFGQVFWPACGEIDIMEHWGNNQNFVQSAMHTPSSFGNTVNHGGQIIPTASTDFHVYELEWMETKMVFSVDGVVHYTYSPPVRDANTWPFDGEQFILLNIAIEPTIGANFTQSAMEIDYVRVYQESPLSLPNNEESLALKYFPNPVDNQFTVQFERPIFQPITFEIYQLDGRLVKTETVKSSGSQVTLQDLGGLQNGVYVLVFELENETYRTKMIKK